MSAECVLMLRYCLVVCLLCISDDSCCVSGHMNVLLVLYRRGDKVREATKDVATFTHSFCFFLYPAVNSLNIYR